MIRSCFHNDPFSRDCHLALGDPDILVASEPEPGEKSVEEELKELESLPAAERLEKTRLFYERKREETIAKSAAQMGIQRLGEEITSLQVGELLRELNIQQEKDEKKLRSLTPLSHSERVALLRKIEQRSKRIAIARAIQHKEDPPKKEDIALILEYLSYEDEELIRIKTSYAEAAILHAMVSPITVETYHTGKGLLENLFPVEHNDAQLSAIAIVEATRLMAHRWTRVDQQDLLADMETVLNEPSFGKSPEKELTFRKRLLYLFLERHLTAIEIWRSKEELARSLTVDYNTFIHGLAKGMSPKMVNELLRYRVDTSDVPSGYSLAMMTEVLDEVIDDGVNGVVDITELGKEHGADILKRFKKYREEKDPEKRAEMREEYLDDLRFFVGVQLLRTKRAPEEGRSPLLPGQFEEVVEAVKASDLPLAEQDRMVEILSGIRDLRDRDERLSTAPEQTRLDLRPLQGAPLLGRLEGVHRFDGIDTVAASLPTVREIDKNPTKYALLTLLFAGGLATTLTNSFNILSHAAFGLWYGITFRPGKALEQFKTAFSQLFGTQGVLSAAGIGMMLAASNPDGARRALNGVINGAHDLLLSARRTDVGASVERAARSTIAFTTETAQSAWEKLIKPGYEWTSLRVNELGDFLSRYGGEVKGEMLDIKENHRLVEDLITELRGGSESAVITPVLSKVNDLALTYGGKDPLSIPRGAFMEAFFDGDESILMGTDPHADPKTKVHLEFEKSGEAVFDISKQVDRFKSLSKPDYFGLRVGMDRSDLWSHLDAEALEYSGYLSKGQTAEAIREASSDLLNPLTPSFYRSPQETAVEEAMSRLKDPEKTALIKRISNYPLRDRLGIPFVDSDAWKEGKDEAEQARELVHYALLIDLLEGMTQPKDAAGHEEIFKPKNPDAFGRKFTALHDFVQKREHGTSFTYTAHGEIPRGK